jgi:hypothetical protein
MQSVMYELMSELNDRSEDLERQMAGLRNEVQVGRSVSNSSRG